jgi:uncharacterized protein (TIGR02996 family)
MKDVKSWIKAIRAEVEDDIPRLACADWLEERGQTERAEFIRVQCALARIEGDDPRRPDLARREEELLDAHEAEWLKELPAWAAKARIEFRRGFVAEVAAGVKTFLSKAAGLFARAPVTRLFTRIDKAGLEALTDSAHLAGLCDLSLGDADPAGVARLLASPHAAGLRGLHLVALAGFAARFAALAPVLESPKLAELTRLSIRHVGFDEADVRHFVRLPALRGLETLRLESWDATDTSLRELAAAELPKLRSLDLACNQAMTDETVRALAESEHLRNLTLLDLRNSRVGDTGLRALAQSTNLPNLTDLGLLLIDVTVAGVRTLLESPNLPRLSRIELLRSPDLAAYLPVRGRRGLPDSDIVTLWVRDVKR